MAEILGLTRSTYRYHERVSHFTPEQIEKVADFFNVTVESLEDDTIDFTPKSDTARLHDVKQFHLVVGNTLIPSDLVLKMEELSKMTLEKRVKLMKCLDAVIESEDDNDNESSKKSELLLNCIELLLSDDNEKIEAVKKYIEFLNF